MKIRIILIVLDFIQLCFSLQTNVTYNDDYGLCPNSSRAKRALSEYTRWRANQATKQEFIVKVDDDVLNPAVRASTQVFAINIQPSTRKPESIIVSGAVVPAGKAAATTYVPLEYTRFVPPTTVKITQFNGDLYLLERDPLAEEGQSPKDEINSQTPKLMAKHAERDESPPASPQFISRTPAHVARQYAPITPVAFFPRSGVSPLTPPTLNKPVHRTTLLPPPVRSTLPNFEIPTRVELEQEAFVKFHPDANLLETLLISSENEGRISHLPHPTRADEISHETDTPTRATYTTQNWSEEDEVTVTLKTTSTDLESGYHIAYDDIDDNESTTSKTESDKSFEEEDTRRKEDNLGTESEDDYVSTDSDIYVDNTTSLSIEDGNFEDQNEKTTLENSTTKKKTTQYYNTTATLSYDYDETSTPQSFREKRRPSCNLRKLRDLSFKSPRTLPEIVAQLKKWTDDSPIAKWVDITDDTYTVMENPIYMMIIDDPSSGQILSAKQVVLIVAGIQGRDHHAVAAAMYVLYQLIERSESHADLLSKYRFWVVPVLNPDGYDYSMTFPQRREWTKNLRQSWDTCSAKDSCVACEATGLRCTVQPCYGVNLDRNFEYQWIPPEERRSDHACGGLYAGPRQLSELETAAITHFLHVQGSPLHTFIAVKEGDVLGVMYPYSHTKKKRAFDHVFRQRAARAASAAYSISGRPYVAGQTSEFLPLYAGGIEDWVDGHLGIDNTYSVMMFRPTDTNNPRVTTERVVHEAYAAMDTLLMQSLEPYNTQILRQVRSAGSGKTTSSILASLAACLFKLGS